MENENDKSLAKHRNISVDEYFKCPVCWNFAMSPIHTCPNGHIVCGMCRLTISVCGICKLSLAPNGFAERIIRTEEFIMTCPNDGCNLQTKASEMIKHTTNLCYYRLIECLEGKIIPCKDVRLGPMDMFEHWKEKHGMDRLPVHVEKIQNKTMYIVFRKLSLSVVKNPVMCSQWPTSYFGKSDEQIFFMHARREMDYIYIWVTFLGSDDEALKYTYNVTLSNSRKTNKMIISFNHLPVRCLQFYDIDLENCTSGLAAVSWSSVYGLIQDQKKPKVENVDELLEFSVGVDVIMR